MRRISARTTDALAILDRKIGSDTGLRQRLAIETLNAEIGQRIHELRTNAGLSQRQLAGRVGTTAAAIARLEESDYRGNALAMLQRIATALGRRIELRLPTDRRHSAD